MSTHSVTATCDRQFGAPPRLEQPCPGVEPTDVPLAALLEAESDVVVAYLPNVPETIAAFLATV
jgi:hypothetical protein